MDSNEGGILTLYKQHRLDGRIEETRTDGPPRSEPQPIQDGGKYILYDYVVIRNVSLFDHMFLVFFFFFLACRLA